ncbi:Mobile element protein [Candidatus Enterovibrio altilux]|uniref:Mobile element protein n=1 Tax=Candidatus Enterovibrio altilux TaxID=1927128 RepID=A0A291B6M7_9GAMM|nr:Mobile element protein [Candidatus Enterovibrio luxaltus]
MDEEIIQLWNQTKQDNHGRPRLLSDLPITMAFIVKRVFSIPLRGL